MSTVKSSITMGRIEGALAPWRAGDGQPLTATDGEIADVLGVSHSTVANWRARLGIPPRPGRGGRPVNGQGLRAKVQACLRRIGDLPPEVAVELLGEIADDVGAALDKAVAR